MTDKAFLSVIIPTLNAADALPSTLSALAATRAGGGVREVVIVDGGSCDATIEIARNFGALVLKAPQGRGMQLGAGARAASGSWLLFLHADTRLEDDWETAARAHCAEAPLAAGAFRLCFDADGWRATLIARLAMARAAIFALPYGDQGLLISRTLYDAIGGYREIPLFEDVELVRRLVRQRGRKALRILRARAVTSAARYRRDGYFIRVLKNQILLSRYLLGESPERLAKAYRR